ncbi:MAG: helix-turn-helix domain-containing protein [Moorellales bacterium]
MDIGKKIAVLRKSLGMSKRELARRSGIALSYLHELEKGGKSPTLHTLEKLCDALGANLKMLLDNDREDKISPEHRRLQIIARSLTPDQARELVHFLEAMRKPLTTEEAAALEQPILYPALSAASQQGDGYKLQPLAPETLEELEKAKRKKREWESARRNE